MFPILAPDECSPRESHTPVIRVTLQSDEHPLSFTEKKKQGQVHTARKTKQNPLKDRLVARGNVKERRKVEQT